MQKVDVTDEVWKTILAARSDINHVNHNDWSLGETQALAVYSPLVTADQKPFIFAQIGQSLDGRIATETGDAQDVSGRDGLAHLHRLRALADAVVIGAKTALHDDPQLTVRLAAGKNPVRVVIDPNGRLPNSLRLFQDNSVRRIIIQTVDKARPAGIEVIRLERDKWIAPYAISDALTRMGFRSILIEGGGITIAQFLEAGLLNRLHIAVAPLLIGSGPQGLTTAPVGTLAMARRPRMDIYNLGSDILFDCALTPLIQSANRCAAEPASQT